MPVLTDIPFGYPLTPVDHIDKYYPLPEAMVDDPKAFLLKIEDDNFSPDFDAGDLILVSPRCKTEIKGTGEYAVVRIGHGKPKIRCIHKEKRGIILSSRNPKYPPQLIAGHQTLEIIGKVILKIHFY